MTYTDREINAVLFRLRSHNSKLGFSALDDMQEAADLIERLQRRIAKLESDIEAAYAETEQGEA